MFTIHGMKLNRTTSNYKIYNVHLSKFCHTGNLEFYHSFLTKYFPKRQDFNYDHLNCRTTIVDIDHNVSQNRDQTVDEHGIDVNKTVCSNEVSNWVAKPVFCTTPLMFEQLDLNYWHRGHFQDLLHIQFHMHKVL